MIKVKWPLTGSDKDENEVCAWLENLVMQDRGVMVFELSKDLEEIHFTREEDAIAFKLTFGL